MITFAQTIDYQNYGAELTETMFEELNAIPFACQYVLQVKGANTFCAWLPETTKSGTEQWDDSFTKMLNYDIDLPQADDSEWFPAGPFGSTIKFYDFEDGSYIVSLFEKDYPFIHIMTSEETQADDYSQRQASNMLTEQELELDIIIEGATRIAPLNGMFFDAIAANRSACLSEYLVPFPQVSWCGETAMSLEKAVKTLESEYFNAFVDSFNFTWEVGSDLSNEDSIWVREFAPNRLAEKGYFYILVLDETPSGTYAVFYTPESLK